ncbi:hypothetical protein Tco_0151004 [Tanacetum coccineum]
MSATTTSSTPAYLLEITALTDAVKAILLQNKTPSPAPVKAIEKTCMTCGGPHPYYKCLATGGNTFDACAVVGTYNQGGNRYCPQGDPNYHASNQMGFHPRFPPTGIYYYRSGVLLMMDSMISPTFFYLPKGKRNVNQWAQRTSVSTTISLGSTAHVQPLVVQVPIREPDVAPNPNPKLSIPYPSRLNDQKL